MPQTAAAAMAASRCRLPKAGAVQPVQPRRRLVGAKDGYRAATRDRSSGLHALELAGLQLGKPKRVNRK